MKENYLQPNKAFTTIIVVFLLVFFCACSTKKQLTSSRNTAVAVDTATAVSAFRYLQPKQPYYYSHFPNQFRYTNLPKPKVLTTKDKYEIAFENLQNMLNGNEAIDFEKAIFISENVYYQNKVSYDDYLKVLDRHTKRIKALIVANDKSDTMDFTTYANFRERGLSYTSLRYTEKEKRELYRKALSNWAIFTYLTDTLTFGKKEQLPFTYKIEDPFGMDNWSNSQVLHLLGSTERKGNCFALVALFKILSNRLNTEAYICTAPQHIYLQHRDVKGDFYNLELATGTYPSDGTLMTLTFTYKEAIMSGISLRRLKQDKQNIVLCLVNLGKSYEHKFQTKEDTFMLKCADLALQHDSLNLNAMLLKQQVLEERVMNYATENSITNLTAINTLEIYQQLEKHTLHLFDKGYRQMPLYMQEIILSKLRKDNKPIVIKDRTPNPFTSIKVPAKNRRYSTLSGGLYEEVHETKQFEQFGYFVLDTKLRKLVKIEPSYNKELLIDPVVFAWSVDPMAHERVSWSPYNAFRNNPILNIDPTGALDKEYDKDGNLISDLGGDQVNFYHQENGDTKIEDQTTCATNTIKGGEAIIRGYTQRDPNISWSQIATEWDGGTGPAKSMIADFNNSTSGAFGSLNSAFSSYASAARESSLNSNKTKDFVNMTYANANPFVAEDMWEQMWGRTKVNWYKLGDKTLFLMTDSKSMTSFAYRALPSWERSTFGLNGNTYQTYIWTETNYEVQSKVNIKSNYIHLQYQKMLLDSKNPIGPKY